MMLELARVILPALVALVACVVSGVQAWHGNSEAAALWLIVSVLAARK